MREEIMRDGKPCIKTAYCHDFGPAGCAHVTVYDPCVSEAARRSRKEALETLCGALIQNGQIGSGGKM